MNSRDNIQYDKNHNFVKFDQKRSNLPAFLAEAAAFIVDDRDFVMEDAVFFFVFF
jgi:hypothetical protein